MLGGVGGVAKDSAVVEGRDGRGGGGGAEVSGGFVSKYGEVASWGLLQEMLERFPGLRVVDGGTAKRGEGLTWMRLGECCMHEHWSWRALDYK